MFKKILIANRGEIAVRVVRACREMGIASVSVYSEADTDALHARLADEAVCCGPPRATESYLDIAKIVSIAKETGADAVHPGYGFLSENADFAKAVTDAGITFIGPTPEVIAAMGLKIAARERMIAAGVPVVPGGDRIEDPAEAAQAAEAMGYPVLVKASAGGGGRGMRRVDGPEELEAALERAASEAEAAFGDGAVYLEKFVDGPRHIEFQVMSDAHGHTIHLGERECSIQRRHQKLVEESPAYGMTDEVRAAMGDAAVRAAEAVGYVGAGTVEFLMDASGSWYFLEMNTRIQVEHPVTEAVTGVDLVQTQIRMAAGEKLELAQSQVALSGHAIEVRIYAEDPDKGFIPSPGPIVGWRAPEGAGIRLDTGFEGGQTVTPHYDPMIAKLIVHADTRAAAIDQLAAALDDYVIAGIRTGLPFLRRVCENAVYRKGQYDTAFIEDHMSDPLPPLDDATRDLVFAAVGKRASEEQAGATAFEVALPKTEALAVRCDGDGVTVEGRAIALDVLREDGPIVELASAGVLTLVPRKKGGYDVGLRDRMLRVKCDADG
ncbi:MAG: acetyl-CoA carboxylase biotin carboxylase subunit [Deltaproteobacteria bacterium]|nr:acetyl-CoA carboxylase biotin carboxylase subunit [Deltaproteobacteria bacterium]